MYLKWDSYVPKRHKIGLVNTLINRTFKICSSPELFEQEIRFLENTLSNNGYPISFVKSCATKFLRKCNTPKPDVLFGPEQNKLFFDLPYLGSASCTLNRQLQRMMGVIAPGIKLIALFKPVNRLKSLSRLKTPLTALQRSNVVYQLNCLDCFQLYIGKTCRILCNRMKEHSKDLNSSVLSHSIDTGHSIGYSSVVVLDSDNNGIRLLIKESLHIKEKHAENYLNRHGSSFTLQLW